MLLVDSHLDLAWNAIEWNRPLKRSIEDIRHAEKGLLAPGRGCNTVSLPELRKAQVGLFVATILARQVIEGNPPFRPFPSRQATYAAAQKQIEYYSELCTSGELCRVNHVRKLDEHLERWERNPRECPLGFILSMEGADPILDLTRLGDWWQAGLRVIGPVHYGENRFGHGTGSEGGLTDEGRQLLREMDRGGFVLDVTHLSDSSMEEALESFDGPVMASHHNCRSLVPGERQLSDHQIKVLIKRSAVIGLALDAWMLTPGWERGISEPGLLTIESVVDHIDYISQLAGNCDHVGIGSDLDGGFGTEQCPGDLNTIADLQRLVDLLGSRGYSRDQIRNIMHGNWVRFFRSSLPSN